MRYLRHRYHTKNHCPHLKPKVESGWHAFTRKHKIAISIIQIVFFTVIAESVIWTKESFDVNAQAASAFSEVSQTQTTQLSKATSENEAIKGELEAIKAKYPNPTQPEIESYIKTIFGADAATAIAISRHECGPWSKQYPGCVHLSDVEDSIGLFQINLHNSHQNIHAARIPGANMAQKEEWLKNPFQNTLYAFWVFKTSGFTPWSTYTSGAYLK